MMMQSRKSVATVWPHHPVVRCILAWALLPASGLSIAALPPWTNQGMDALFNLGALAAVVSFLMILQAVAPPAF